MQHPDAQLGRPMLYAAAGDATTTAMTVQAGRDLGLGGKDPLELERVCGCMWVSLKMRSDWKPALVSESEDEDIHRRHRRLFGDGSKLGAPTPYSLTFRVGQPRLILKTTQTWLCTGSSSADTRSHVVT